MVITSRALLFSQVGTATWVRLLVPHSWHGHDLGAAYIPPESSRGIEGLEYEGSMSEKVMAGMTAHWLFPA